MKKKENRHIVFIGGVGSLAEFGGEPSKNKEIIRRLKNYGCNISIIDTLNSRKNYLKLLRIICLLFYYMVFYPRSIFVFSTSFGNIYKIIKIMNTFPCKFNIIYWTIGGILHEKIKEGTYDLKYFKSMNRIIVEGNKMKNELKAMNLDNVIAVPNFKNIDYLPPIKKYKDGKTHFVFLSRIMPEKGVDYIFEATSILKNIGYSDQFCIDFYGEIDKDYRQEFKKTIRTNNNLFYKGKIDLRKNENYDILAQYHCMLFPTYWSGEGFPGVIIDAYKSGLPIISSDWNFNQEFIFHEETGIICKTHNVNELYLAMEKVIRNKTKFLEMSITCQNKVWDYSTEIAISEDFIKNNILA